LDVPEWASDGAFGQGKSRGQWLHRGRSARTELDQQTIKFGDLTSIRKNRGQSRLRFAAWIRPHGLLSLYRSEITPIFANT